MRELLRRAGHAIVEDPAEADWLIVNTCGFIAPARDESIAALRELEAGKLPGQKLIAAGCLSQLAGASLVREVPGLDGVLGTRRWMDLLTLIERLRPGAPRPLVHLPAEAQVVGQDERGVTRAAIQGASAYLKIADGCGRQCAFCSIPCIKGTAVSRPAGRIVAEAVHLAGTGVKEIILIAQDTSAYGRDRGEKDALAGLLERLGTAVPNIPWIRVMYAYPGLVTPRLIETMAANPRVLPYLDIPLQHAHPELLRRMRRPADTDRVRATLAKLREFMPEIAIRTTFLVGFPGETESEFEALLDFVQEIQFDRVGVFQYWQEPGTPAAGFPDQVPEEVKAARRESLMALQQPISLGRNQAQVGRTLEVLIEGHGDGVSVGRSYRDAPEIDGLVFVEEELPVGAMVPVIITGAMPHDLMGEAVGKAS